MLRVYELYFIQHFVKLHEYSKTNRVLMNGYAGTDFCNRDTPSFSTWFFFPRTYVCMTK